jgi:copper(I)-binding protein
MSTPIRLSARRAPWVVVAAAALFAVTACSSGGSSPDPGRATSGAITASAFHVNEPSVPERTGAFGTITNSSSSFVRLTQVTVPASIAESASLHETVMVDGEMKMQELADGIPVPAQGKVVLESRGLHIMLMKPTISVGQKVPLTLMFNDGTTVTVEADVTAPSADTMSPSSGGSM